MDSRVPSRASGLGTLTPLQHSAGQVVRSTAHLEELVCERAQRHVQVVGWQAATQHSLRQWGGSLGSSACSTGERRRGSSGEAVQPGVGALWPGCTQQSTHPSSAGSKHRSCHKRQRRLKEGSLGRETFHKDTFTKKSSLRPTWICSAEAEPGSTPLSSMPRAWATEKGEMIWPPFSAGLVCRYGSSRRGRGGQGWQPARHARQPGVRRAGGNPPSAHAGICTAPT